MRLFHPRKQFHIEIPFQSGHLAAHGTLRHEQFFRSAREALVPGSGFEHLERAKVWDSFHQFVPFANQVCKLNQL